MDYVRRVYIAGVGYNCYLTEQRLLTGGIKVSNASRGIAESAGLVRQSKFVTVANLTTFTKEASMESSLTSTGSSSKSIIPLKYVLNLKIGYSDVKEIDITSYISDNLNPVEILIVGKEILTTPGYMFDSRNGGSENGPLGMSAAGAVVSPIKAIIIIRGKDKKKVNSLAALIRNVRPYSVYKGIGLRLQGEPLNIKLVVKNKQKAA